MCCAEVLDCSDLGLAPPSHVSDESSDTFFLLKNYICTIRYSITDLRVEEGRTVKRSTHGFVENTLITPFYSSQRNYFCLGALALQTRHAQSPKRAVLEMKGGIFFPQRKGSLSFFVYHVLQCF
ncbi:Hypothetical predicted protein [Xyrichtys novacula]|uniref:Uncharacterized protein n=1 Tax=Xyrichtys novacula TaxID=13765 RepID=A0AAV1EIP5_XYRNO|nr:Hypothetical predicted protein [Xyrichtys novacula]